MHPIKLRLLGHPHIFKYMRIRWFEILLGRIIGGGVLAQRVRHLVPKVSEDKFADGGWVCPCGAVGHKGKIKSHKGEKRSSVRGGRARHKGRRDSRVQVTRTLPGKILSQGVSNSIDGYLAGSLQRRAVINTEAKVSRDVEILKARGVMLELLPDCKESLSVDIEKITLDGTGAEIVAALGFQEAVLKKSAPIKFACRYNPDRAIAAIAALSAEEKAKLPSKIDITCHMCGRTFTIERHI